MALSEERSEQTQQQWLSRLARERQDLSASVEAALVDRAAQGHGWQDEEMGEDDLSRGSQDKTLIPPRLSLQSRVLPAIRPGDFVREAAQSHHTVVPKVEAEEKPVPATQSQGVWARFAQRLTASFAVFGSVMHPEAEPYAPPAAQEHLRELPGLQEAIPPPRTFPAEPGIPAVYREAYGIAEMHAPARPQVAPEAIHDGVGRQRMAGHKIRLETAPIAPDMPERVTPRASVEMQEIQEKKAPAPALTLDRLAEDEGMTSAHLPALRGYEGTTSAHLPALEVSRVEAAPAQLEKLSGSSAFESGQCDVSVANKRITPSSVVLVTLTANPGPVVVQYVSLQPQIGFTVHLTAPAAMRVPFNYMILAGE